MGKLFALAQALEKHEARSGSVVLLDAAWTDKMFGLVEDVPYAEEPAAQSG